MPNNRADMYLVMLRAWRLYAGDGCDWGVPASTIAADEALDRYLDSLWWSLNTAELVHVTEEMQRQANAIRASK